MTFLQNKYTKYYYQIINHALNQNRVKLKPADPEYLYYELHHILPRCLEGTNDSNNLVLLTSREHFICHALLCKMVSSNNPNWVKLVRAFVQMKPSPSRSNPRYFNSRIYQIARDNIGKVMSSLQSGAKNSQFGKIWVSNTTTKHCIKIDPNLLSNYMERGYQKQRIINFDNHLLREAQKNNKGLHQLDSKIAKLEKQLRELKNQRMLLINGTP